MDRQKNQERQRFFNEPIKMVRSDDGENFKAFAGYGAVFFDPTDSGTEYVLQEGGNGRKRIVERVMSTAFDKMSGDVISTFNHNNSYLLGRKSAGTLQVKVDERGVRYEAQFNPKDTDHTNLAEKIARGDVPGSSFRFYIEKETMIEDGDTIIFQINQVRMNELGPVTDPAYTSTTTQLRQVAEQRQEQIDQLLKTNGRKQIDLDYATAMMWGVNN